MIIRKAIGTDSESIAEIYNYYVSNTVVSFETLPVSRENMAKRITEKLTKYDWIVGEVDKKIVGYAYYGAFKERAAYDKTIESTIYLDKKHLGKGYGRRLYQLLIESAVGHGFCEMIGIIALPNQGSTQLHAKMGFTEAGVLKNVGYKYDRFIDIGLWQKSLK
jgi:L-amino acid N-acyltransferase YncA